MCDNFFEKTNGHGRAVNRTSVYAEAAVRRVLLKCCHIYFCVTTFLKKQMVVVAQ